MPVPVRERADCRYDLVSLGEVMLRLDPGDRRVRTARTLEVSEGGGEYNVARGLRRCFGQRTAVVTALADNEVGRLVEDLILQGGVDPTLIRWVPYDGVGRRVRNGLNFTERGFGVRAPLGVSDRGHTAASQLRPGDVDWDHLFGHLGVRWFHTGGIYAALSDTTPDVVEEAIAAAHRHGTVVSYDLNYRASLWQDLGGKARAQELNQRLMANIDVLIGVPASDHHTDPGVPETSAVRTTIESAVKQFPNLQIVATTLRAVRSASVNDWDAIVWSDGRFFEATPRPGLEIYDRVGGGDSFAAGLIYGLMERGDPQAAVDLGAAHGALTMTTPGDTSMASLAEVEALARGTGAHALR